jgi:hypothetical protein
VDTDTTQGKAYVSVQSYSDYELPIKNPLYYDQSSNIFTPYTVTVTPQNNATVNVYRITQQVEAPTLVTAVGSTKYQAFGYDGPHAPESVQAGMDEITANGMTGTIFADIDYMTPPSYVTYLNGLIDQGWDLAIHFSFYNGNDWAWEDAQTQMWIEYNSIVNTFGGIQPTSFCLLGKGAYADDYKNAWVYENMGMFLRGWRALPQFLGGSHGLTNVTYTYFKGAADAGVATLPTYAHKTENPGNPDNGSIDAALFDAWLASVFANGVRLTGYQDWYQINSNQLDATFQFSNNEGNTTIIANTNGYNAIIVVKIDAGSVTAVTHNGQAVQYTTTLENYLSFEVENGESYVISRAG